ncbi:MAG: hypothetical protein J6C90_00100 [Clostridia bacterium]|nr:hypothetical protein [Clostridia bacterium]
MLNSREKYVMKYLYQKCMGKKNSLITPREVISFVSDKFIMTTEDLDGIMRNLEYDNYIDLTRTDKKGEQVFIVGLKTKGEAFYRELTNNKRTWYFLITRTIMLAILSFIITFLLGLIF